MTPPGFTRPANYHPARSAPSTPRHQQGHCSRPKKETRRILRAHQAALHAPPTAKTTSAMAAVPVPQRHQYPAGEIPPRPSQGRPQPCPGSFQQSNSTQPHHFVRSLRFPGWHSQAAKIRQLASRLDYWVVTSSSDVSLFLKIYLSNFNEITIIIISKINSI